MCSYEERSSVENIEKTCPFIVNLTFFMRRHTGRTGGNHAERIKDLSNNFDIKEIQARASTIDLGRRGLIISKSLRIAVWEKCFLSNSICLI